MHENIEEQRTYFVTLKAFGQERVLKVEATNRHEAIQRAKREIGYSCQCHEAREP